MRFRIEAAFVLREHTVFVGTPEGVLPLVRAPVQAELWIDGRLAQHLTIVGERMPGPRSQGSRTLTSDSIADVTAIRAARIAELIVRSFGSEQR